MVCKNGNWNKLLYGIALCCVVLSCVVALRTKNLHRVLRFGYSRLEQGLYILTTG